MSQATHTVAIETLLREQEWMRRLALRLVGDEHAADDVVQQTWLAALQSPPADRGSLRGWLATVVRNTARKRARGETRRGYHERRADVRTDAPSADDVVMRLDTQQRVGRAVMALAEPYRTTLLLRFFDDLPPGEIARRMDVPVETVRTRVRRALEHVRGRLDREAGGDRSAWAIALIPLIRNPESQAGRATGTGLATAGATLMALTTTQKLAATAAVAVLAALAGIGVFSSAVADPEPDAGATAAADDATTEAASSERSHVRGERRHSADDEIGASGATETQGDAWRRTIRIVSPDGQPVRDATVFVIGDGTAPEGLQLDATGGLQIAADGDDARVLIAAPGRPLHLERVPASATDHVATIGAGETVSGVVRVAGVPPEEPMQIVLRLPQFPEWMDEVTDEEWRAVAPTRHGRSATGVLTTPDGSFTFHGMPAAEGLWIEWPEGYIDARTQEYRASVPSPNASLHLDLAKLPVVRGRVVTPDGKPVPEPVLMLRYHGVHLGMEMGIGEEDGSFEIPLPGTVFDTIEFLITDGDGRSSQTVELLDGRPLDRDLGAIALEEDAVARLTVRNEKGEPIPDAVVVFADDFHDPRMLRTESDGGLDVGITGGRRHLLVGAVGYETQEVILQTPGSLAPVVEMRRTALLSVEIARGEDDAREGAAVELVWAEPPGGHWDSLRADLLSELDVHSAAGDTPDDPNRTFFYGTGRGGTVRITELRTDLPFRVRLRDHLGHTLTERAVQLSEGEHKTLQLEITGEGRTFRGVIRDADGASVDRAHVKIAVDGAPSTHSVGTNVWTDETGAFEIGPVRADRVSLFVLANGFVPWSRTGIAVTGDGKPFEIELTDGRPAEIRIRDEAGRPVPFATVIAHVPGAIPYDGGVPFWVVLASAPGVYHVRDLPQGPVRYEVRHGERTWEFADDGAADVSLTLR